MTPSRHKFVVVLILLLVGTCLTWAILLVACNRALSNRGSVPDSFPVTDIVYRGDTELGFINADGSGAITVPFILGNKDFVATWQSPLMTGDGKTILVTHTSVPGYRGGIFAVPAGEKPVDCGWYGTIRLTADASHILLNKAGRIEKYLPEDCGTGNLPEKVYDGTVGDLAPDELYGGAVGALSTDEQYVADVREKARGVREPKIVVRNIETGEERIIGVGDFPVWSRDGKWLAYTGVDGIYIIQNNPNAQPSRLVPLESPDPSRSVPLPVYQENRHIEYYPSIASWSPDGQWLVYHVYSRDLVAPDEGAWAGHYSIFKVNVPTGETVKLLDGGYSPSWRWPVEEP